jgi:Protein of unknown function (DUF4038)/Putative collagen-binding domain of a collagenase
MKRFAFALICLLTATSLHAQTGWNHGRLKVTADKRYLQFEDGTPFFYLGDTGWELFHRLDLFDIKTYLDNRAAKGFSVIQAVVLAEFDGLKRPNRYGQLPLASLDPLKPNENYFTLVDSTIRMARERNLFIGLLPTWGDKITVQWGEGPAIFDSVNAYKYGFWIGNRYKNDPNIIWILGGDRPAMNDKQDWRPIWRQMARGIIEATNHQCIIGYHPSGYQSSSKWLQQEEWLDINMFQSGHGSGHDVPCWDFVSKDRSFTPVKPTMDAEPNYEDHPVNPWPKWNVDSGYFRDYDVRKQLYRSVFAGACGVTYGHHAVWQFMSEREEVVNHADRGWVNAIDRPGAFQAGYLKRLMESRPSLGRIPDLSLIAEGQGTVNAEHMEAFRAADNSYAMVYLPVGKKIRVNASFLNGKNITAWWFNPKDATIHKIGNVTGKASLEFTAPVVGKGNDWVLVLDDAGKKYITPGK